MTSPHVCFGPSPLEAENAKLHGEILQYRSRLEEESKRAAYAEAMEPAWMEQIADLQASLKKLCDERNALVLQIDAWKRYHALLSEELDSAVGMAYIHGWKSTPEKIERGRKLRLELGIADSGLDAYAGDPFSEKRKCEHPRWVKTAEKESTCLDCKAVFPFKDPKECIHGELKVIHQCADCGDVIEFV